MQVCAAACCTGCAPAAAPSCITRCNSLITQQPRGLQATGASADGSTASSASAMAVNLRNFSCLTTPPCGRR
jgi:hypothetical protein